MLNSVKYLKTLNLRLLKKKLFFAIYLLILLLLHSCALGKRKQLNQYFAKTLNRPLFENQFTGVLVIDPESGDTLYRKNSRKYFTPASNTKIFTLYACLKLLPAQMPALTYLEYQDTLFIRGTGDPSALHPYFQDSTAIQFIRGFPEVSLFSGNFLDDHWGPGWAWEDYGGYYSPERSALPLYGNVVTVSNTDNLKVIPGIFQDSVHALRYPVRRLRESNVFFYDADSMDTIQIPFKTDSVITRKLLESAVGKKIHHAARMPDGTRHLVYSQPADSLYKRMMQESDNFLAEQLLIVASGTLSDTLSGKETRNHVLSAYLHNLPQEPVWVDGSGLSRYNLFSPEDMVFVLHRLYEDLPIERLLALFAAGGVSGTLKEWYGQEGEPYLYAKTGTLANNHCLSGYLKTRSGRILIFSFMNNHYMQNTVQIKEQMQGLFEWLRDQY